MLRKRSHSIVKGRCCLFCSDLFVFLPGLLMVVFRHLHSELVLTSGKCFILRLRTGVLCSGHIFTGTDQGELKSD